MRFNQLTIGGHLGRDAEVKTTNSGQTVTEFSVAVSGWQKDSESTWFRCSWWGDRGPKIAQYLTKGKPVIVSGEVSLRMYEKRDGGTGASLEVRVNDVALAGGKDDGERAAPAPRPAAREASPPPAPVDPVPDFPGDDLDIPFD